MNEFQEWCKEILPIVQAAANGETIEYDLTTGGWETKEHADISKARKYRIKPKTIRIGEYDVPEPCREPLENGDLYWIADLGGESPLLGCTWREDRIDDIWLLRGIIHRTQEAADIHSKALISLSTRLGSYKRAMRDYQEAYQEYLENQE